VKNEATESTDFRKKMHLKNGHHGMEMYRVYDTIETEIKGFAIR
jgi:hypothetical protein